MESLSYWERHWLEMRASGHLLNLETSLMHYSGVIFVHFFPQSSNIESSVGLLCELWFPVLSIDFQLD